MLENKTILFFGATGSLGNAFIKKHIHKNKIIAFSRDESKHWAMSLQYNHTNLEFVIGDIRDKDRVETTIIRENPHIIIIASALKHVDRCEFAVHESIETNLRGPKNVLDVVEKNATFLKNLECVLFVSTDKACEPTNVYGMCKALAESTLVEKSLYVKGIKFVNIRYGNVLNSRGSIIPILNEVGRNKDRDSFVLTHEEMTRFVMTLDQSVNLIEYAIDHGKSGETIIPELISMKVKDLIELFSEKYNKPIRLGIIRPGEKLFESLISDTQSERTYKDENNFYHIMPSYQIAKSNIPKRNYNSTINTLNKERLREFLESFHYLDC